jgi:hypothetical protein
MESASVKTHDIDGDWLDAALEAAAQEHRAAYVADDGFTANISRSQVTVVGYVLVAAAEPDAAVDPWIQVALYR